MFDADVIVFHFFGCAFRCNQSIFHFGGNVYFSVFDNGVGIKQKDIEKIFDPFFTTKREDKGTGLGLSISYGFIKDILGEIKVESQENEFTRFDVIIPKS